MIAADQCLRCSHSRAEHINKTAGAPDDPVCDAFSPMPTLDAVDAAERLLRDLGEDDPLVQRVMMVALALDAFRARCVGCRAFVY